jgi:hypothetical protein
VLSRDSNTEEERDNDGEEEENDDEDEDSVDDGTPTAAFLNFAIKSRFKRSRDNSARRSLLFVKFARA